MTRRALPLALLLAASAHAQTDADHRAAAAELVEVLDMETAFFDGVRVGLDASADAPGMDEMRPVMEAFFDRYITWDKVVDDYVALYQETFSQAELEELVAFYRSPIGQRLVEEQSGLMARGARVGQDLMAEHETELMTMLMGAMREDGMAPPPPSKSAPRK